MAEPTVQVTVSLIERLMMAASDFGVRDEEAVALAYAVKSEHAPLIPSFTPPRIEDMAPGTTFTASYGKDLSATTRWMRCTGPSRCVNVGGVRFDAHAIDPSTIRDVQPPKEPTA